jgi:hypothetical protein
VLRNALERGSAEAFGMFLYPWVFWGLVRLVQQPSRARFVIATMLWAACIARHVLAPLMLLPFAGLLALALAWRCRSPAPLLALLAGVLVTAFIWLPMVPEQSWVHVERDFKHPEAIPLQNPLPLSEALAMPAVYDLASGSNGSGDRVGIPYVLPLLAAIPLIAWALLHRRRDLAAYLAFAAASGLVLF